MKKRLPLIFMLLVLSAPFIFSAILLSDKSGITDTAKGTWFSNSEYIADNHSSNWKLLWREQDCIEECESWFGLLQRVQMALGKHSEKLDIEKAENKNLLAHENGLFIADHQGLILLSYEASEDGAYRLLKDLKVLMKHGGA